MDLLSSILLEFNDMWGNIDWKYEDNVREDITVRIPEMVLKDEKYQNAMKNSDEQGARLEAERASMQAILAIMADNIELYRLIQNNSQFKKWVLEAVFALTYKKNVK